MRIGVVLGVVLVSMYGASLGLTGGAAAEDLAGRTEAGGGVVAERSLSGRQMWAGEPWWTGSEAAVGVAPGASGSSSSPAVAEPAGEENDDLVPVALATFGVAVAAMVVGLAAYLLRLRLGLVQPPPPSQKPHEPE